MRLAIEVIWAAWGVLGMMSPYLLLGFAVAGLLSVMFSPRWIERHLGRESFSSVLKAAVFGIPLPLCSCGVLPVSAAMRQHGASRAAAVSFLISTPQTGVDSIAATYALLGPVIAIYRPIVALLSGVFGGFLVYRFGIIQSQRSNSRHTAVDSTQALSDKQSAPGSSCTESCGAIASCINDNSARDTASPPIFRVWAAMKYGFIDLPRDIGGHLLFGALVAGALTVLVPPSAMATWLGGGIAAMLLMVIAAVPFYVCATGSVPIALGLIHMGASPGTAFAFLVAGPVSNAAGLTLVGKLLGFRVLVIYLTTVVASAVGGGLLLDQILMRGNFDATTIAHCLDSTEGLTLATHLWAGLLVGLIAAAYLRPRLGANRGKDSASSLSRTSTEAAESRALGNTGRAIDDTSKQNSSTDTSDGRLARLIQPGLWRIGGMRCTHCANTIRDCVARLPGVEQVDVDFAASQLSVSIGTASVEQIEQAVRALGYSIEEITLADVSPSEHAN